MKSLKQKNTYEKEEYVLAKWLSGEVSDQQLKDQVGDDHVESYRVILNELESLAALNVIKNEKMNSLSF